MTEQTFAEIGSEHFQNLVMAALLVDKEYADRMIEVVRTENFSVDSMRVTHAMWMTYFEEYKAYPSTTMIRSMVIDELSKEPIMAKQVTDFLDNMSELLTKPSDVQYAKERSLDFCKKQRLKEALVGAVDDLKHDKYGAVVMRLKHAVELGVEKNVGHEYDGEDEIFMRMQDDADRCPVPTPWPIINNEMQGGLGKGELGVVIAPTGAGKSHFLVALGSAAIQQGFNVLHYTLELRESIVARRYDANLLGAKFEDVPGLVPILKDRLKEVTGKLIIKKYPTKKAGISQLSAHIERLKSREFTPDLIIVDYADLLRSSKQYEAKRYELELLYEELRALGDELELPIWTASQANRGAHDAELVTISAIGEAYAKAQIADVILTLSRTNRDKMDGGGRSLLAKNRSGRDGIIYPIMMNTSSSTIEFLLPDENQEVRDLGPLDETSKFEIMKQAFARKKANQ